MGCHNFKDQLHKNSYVCIITHTLKSEHALRGKTFQITLPLRKNFPSGAITRHCMKNSYVINYNRTSTI